MTDYPDSIAIVFPADWPSKDVYEAEDPVEPHVTILFLGNISEVNYTKQDVVDVLARLQIKAPGSVVPTGLEFFGKEEDILVLTLDDSKLVEVRASLERALEKIGASNASEYIEYRPHVTIDENLDATLEEAAVIVGELPQYVSLYAPVVWWGNER